MKEIKERRFQKKKPEDIGFAAPSMAERTSERSSVRPNTRPNVQPKEPPLTADPTTPAYIITIPATRRKIRHAFDICEDHLDALKKIQMAERDLSGKRSGKTLGDIAQEALDDWVHKQAKHLRNIEIRHSEE